MRVISGKYRGRNLIAPEGMNTRPTMDRVKEAMFSILGFRLQDAVILDLFAGSGGLAIEALSRGAKKAYINDLSKDAIGVIKKNLASIKVGEEVILTNKDYNELLLELNEKIDILFLDPPYKMNVYFDICSKLEEKKILSSKAILVLEMDLNTLPIELENYQSKIYKYGSKKLQIMRKI